MSNATVTRQDLLNDFNAVVAETEHLLKSVAAVGGEKAQSMRASVEQNLKVAKERLQHLEEAALEQARGAARATDQYVRGHPWQSLAIVAAIAAIVGIVIGLLLNRR